MNKTCFIEQQIALGYSLHQNDGIWWQQQSPFYCKSALRYEKMLPGEARPLRLMSIAGYSHFTPDVESANSMYSVMMMEWERGQLFDMSALSSRRRSAVRRGQKKNEVRVITDLEPILEDVRQVVISTRLRTGVGLPVAYYEEKYKKWRKDMLALFEMRDRFWWGAFIDGQLVAYYHTILVEDTLSIGAAKSHTEFLANCPNDTILYSVMCHAFNELGCRYIEYGDWAENDDKLFYFKQSYGFSKWDFPEYRYMNPILRPLLNMRKSLNTNANNE